MTKHKLIATSIAAMAACFASAGVANATAIILTATYTPQVYVTTAKDTIKFVFTAFGASDLVYSRNAGPFVVDGDTIPVASGPGSYTLAGFTAKGITIDYVLSAVPETATWAMMLIGMGAIGIAARRRPSVKVTYA